MPASFSCTDSGILASLNQVKVIAMDRKGEELLEVAHLAAIIGVLCHPQDGGKGSEIEKEMKRDRGERKERSAHLLCWDIAHLSVLEQS